MPEYPIIETKRLILRGPKQSDLQQIFDIRSDPETVRYFGVLPYTSLEPAQRDIDWINKLLAENTGFRPVITLKGDDSFIGDIGFYDYDKKHNKAEIGYLIAKEHWGKGLMSEALPAVLRYGYEVMGLNRVQALVDARNTASWKLLKKNGFKFEGTLRDYEYEHGDYVDLDMYSLLRREFK